MKTKAKASTLSGFSDAMALASKRKEKNRRVWEKKLGEPIVFIPDKEPEDAALGFGQGLFKTAWGVLLVERLPNGYDPGSRIQYTNEFIDALIRVRDGKKKVRRQG